MLCKIMKPFNRRGEFQTPGSIIDLTEEAVLKLDGYIQPATCQARKIKPDRICGAPLRTGNNGFLSCSDIFCQVPYEEKLL